MNEPRMQPDDLPALIAAVLDGQPSRSEHARLARLLKTDAEARELYVRQATVHALLERFHTSTDSRRECIARARTRVEGEAPSPPAAPGVGLPSGVGFVPDLPSLVPPPSVTLFARIRRAWGRACNAVEWAHHPRRFWGVTAVLTILLCGAFYLLVVSSMHGVGLARRHAQQQQPRPVVAQLAAYDGAVWADGKWGIPTIGRTFREGDTLALQEGMAYLLFENRAVVVLHAESVFTFTSRAGGTLQRGALLAQVTRDEARGFTIDTPFATVTDLGTEFGVAVDDDAADVEVYQGEVVLEVADIGGRKRAVRISAGGTAKADRAGRLTTGTGGAERLDIVRDMSRAAEREAAAMPDDVPPDAHVLFGPADYTMRHHDIRGVMIVTAADLNGRDELYITYSVSVGPVPSDDGWLTVAFNTPVDDCAAFTKRGVFGGLLRVRDAKGTSPHVVHRAVGRWADDDASAVAMAAGESHAARITIGGLASRGGFVGTLPITFEIDHHATSFRSADRNYRGTIDFGTNDVGLNIDLRMYLGRSQFPRTARNVTVWQAGNDEPSANRRGGGSTPQARR